MPAPGVLDEVVRRFAIPKQRDRVAPQGRICGSIRAAISSNDVSQSEGADPGIHRSGLGDVPRTVEEAVTGGVARLVSLAKV